MNSQGENQRGKDSKNVAGTCKERLLSRTRPGGMRRNCNQSYVATSYSAEQRGSFTGTRARVPKQLPTEHHTGYLLKHTPPTPPQRFFSTFYNGKFKRNRGRGCRRAHPPILTTQPTLLPLCHWLHGLPSHLSFSTGLYWRWSQASGKSVSGREKSKHETPGQGVLLCFSNTEEVCVGGMEGMRGQLRGEEIRHNRTNRRDRHPVQILAAHCNSFGLAIMEG